MKPYLSWFILKVKLTQGRQTDKRMDKKIGSKRVNSMTISYPT